MHFNITLPAFIAGLFFSFQVHSKEKTEIEIPVLADVGIGFGHLHSDVDITSNDQTVYVFKPHLSGVVESETLKKYKDKIPKSAPKWLKHADISYSPFPLPDSIYFTQSKDGDDKVFGFSIGPNIGIGGGFKYLRLSGGVGLRATYLYMENDLFDEHHFISLGASANYQLTFTPIRYLQLEVGKVHTWHIEDQLSNNQYLGKMDEGYVMLHLRFPFDAKVSI